MLWIAVHLPLLSLETFCATLPPADAARPVALVGEHKVEAANTAAARRGIQPGIKRATALALAADVLLGQRNALRDDAALHAVAHAALAFTPMVTLHGAATVLLDVQTTLRYFGGLSALLARLQRALSPLGHSLRIASAPTPLGAALLAAWQGGQAGRANRSRSADWAAAPQAHQAPSTAAAALVAARTGNAGPVASGALHGRDGLDGLDVHPFSDGPHSTDLLALQQLLDDAPVWLLGPGREHWEALQGMGLQTLSDLRHLPRTGLARRFGEDLLEDLDAALGLRPDPRQPLLPPPVFESRLELFARADTTAQVLHGAAVLLARLVAWAQAQQARVAAFTLQMQHEPPHRPAADDGLQQAASTPLHIELAEPSLDAEHLQLLLRERLARVDLLAPTLDLRLECRDIARVPAPNGELFATRHGQAHGLARLFERLRARLGEEQVLRIVPVADHRPEVACGVQPVSAAAAKPQLLPPADDLPLCRPVWLLPAPQPLAVRGGQPLAGGRALQLVAGPERIESGWWDGGLVTRDYYVAQDADGALLWVFRDRVTAAAGGWFLQGRFG